MKPPSRAVFACLCLVSIAGLSVSAYCCLSSAQLWIPQVTYNAGAVRHGALLRHSVLLVNLSPHAATVYSEPSCGCTVVPDYAVIVRPFSSSVVPVQVHARAVGLGQRSTQLTLYCASGSRAWRQVAIFKYSLHHG